MEGAGGTAAAPVESSVFGDFCTGPRGGRRELNTAASRSMISARNAAWSDRCAVCRRAGDLLLQKMAGKLAAHEEAAEAMACRRPSRRRDCRRIC